MEQTSSNISLLDRFLIPICLFFIFFPWVSFNLNSMDTQPWVLFTNIIFLFIYSGRKLNHFLFFGYLILMPIVIIGFINLGVNSIRGVLSYLIFFSTLHVFYIIFNKYLNHLNYYLPIFNIIWLVGGVLQLVFGTQVLSFLVQVRTSIGRGVTSFAPEPTHYAFFLLFMSWLILLINDKVSKKLFFLIFLNFIFILLVAKSSMVFLYCLLFAVYLLFSYASLTQILKTIPVMGLLVYIFISFISNSSSRISNITEKLIADPLLVIQLDESINARLAAPVLSLHGAFKDFFIPHGFNAYINQVNTLNEDLGNFFWYGYEVDKIMSGTGALLYELGFVGFIIIIFSYITMSGKEKKFRKTLIPFSLLWIFLTGAIPISFTLIPAIIIACYHKNSKFT